MDGWMNGWTVECQMSLDSTITQGQVMSLLCVPINQISELEEQTQGFTAWQPPTSDKGGIYSVMRNI